MTVVWLEILVILILIMLNGFLALAEIAMVSARKVRLQQMATDGNQRARLALEILEDPADFLSTVQIGITLVGILTGVFGGATIAKELAELLDHIPWLAVYSQPVSVTMVVIIITYLALVLGELTPKQIGLQRTEAWAVVVAPLMHRLSRLASPVVRFLSLSTAAILRLTSNQPTGEPEVTEEDLRFLLKQSAEEGVLPGQRNRWPNMSFGSAT